jgi:hypothetical protein
MTNPARKPSRLNRQEALQTVAIATAAACQRPDRGGRSRERPRGHHDPRDRGRQGQLWRHDRLPLTGPSRHYFREAELRS